VQLPLVIADHQMFLKIIVIRGIVRLDDFHTYPDPVVLFVFAGIVPLPVIAAFIKHHTAIDEADYYFVGDGQVLDAGAA